MRAYRTIRETKVGHDHYFDHPKAEWASRRHLKRADRQRAERELADELRREFHEDAVETEAFFKQLGEEAEWYSDYKYPPSRYDDYDSPGDWDWDR